MKIITYNERDMIAERLAELWEMSKKFDIEDFKKSTKCIVEIAVMLDIPQNGIFKESEVSE